MGLSNWARARRSSAVVLGASALFVAGACSGSQHKPAESTAAPEDGPPPPCNRDEVREYLCDDLLPSTAENAAPEPYQTCPQRVGVKGNVFKPTSSVARFDEKRTAWTRKRVPPGHACCYSWCSALVVADADDVDAAACQQPQAMRERLCISAAEAGVSEAASSPNEACASAVAPPASVSFTPPKAAALDLQATAEKRGQGLPECCYGWCSKAPLGTGLGAK